MKTTIRRCLERTCRCLKKLARDECGTVSWAGMIVSTTVFTLGAIVGLATLRDHLVQEYGDMAVAIDHLDQSWSYSNGIDCNGDGDYTDPGECEFRGQFVDSSNLSDPAGDGPADIVFVP